MARLAGAATRRTAVKGALGGALASVGVTSVASAGPKAKGPKKDKKPKKAKKLKCKGKGKDPVTICHKGKTITVSRCALKAHEKHGDDITGPCPY